MEAYRAVFDGDNNIKLCGREACITLITMMSKYTQVNVGNKETGIINVSNMGAEYKKICEEWS